MSIFTESEVNFLNLLTEDIFTESSEKDRSGVLDKTLEVLENLGYNPKISKSSKDKWIKTNNSGDFGESLCILIGQVNNLSKVCTDVNKVIKPMNAKVSPDNYGTIFLAMKESVVTESYIGNYFRNKILLHRLGKNPELNRKSLIKFMKNLATNYESSLLDDEVKEIMKKKDVADYFLPKGSLKFPDGMEIEFAFCYDKKSFTPGAAFKNDDGRYIVLLYPMLFEYDDIEEQLYILMHEIGHIRLGHCERQHQTLFDHENRRGKVTPTPNAKKRSFLTANTILTPNPAAKKP